MALDLPFTGGFLSQLLDFQYDLRQAALAAGTASALFSFAIHSLNEEGRGDLLRLAATLVFIYFPSEFLGRAGLERAWVCRGFDVGMPWVCRGQAVATLSGSQN